MFLPCVCGGGGGCCWPLLSPPRWTQFAADSAMQTLLGARQQIIGCHVLCCALCFFHWLTYLGVFITLSALKVPILERWRTGLDGFSTERSGRWMENEGGTSGWIEGFLVCLHIAKSSSQPPTPPPYLFCLSLLSCCYWFRSSGDC